MQDTRIRAAKAATSALIDCLPDGVRFAIVTGNTAAAVAFPPAPPLAVSTAADPSAGQGERSRSSTPAAVRR